MALADEIRRYWDDDAPTYDHAPQHRPRNPAAVAAWTAAVAHLLPAPPARILDCGAGTGFLSLIAAGLGHQVTALDVSPAMLARLDERSQAAGLHVETMAGDAGDPPHGFDAVIERHLLWTLPDPAATLGAWRAAVTGGGRLVLVESVWGTVDPFERLRGEARRLLARRRRGAPEHHAEYPAHVRQALPLATGTTPERLVELATAAGWSSARLERLRDVEWAERQLLPLPERVLGTAPRFAVVASAHPAN